MCNSDSGFFTDSGRSHKHTQAHNLRPKTHSLFVSNQISQNDHFFCSYMFRKTPNYTVHNDVILFTRAEGLTRISHTETTGSTKAQESQRDVRSRDAPSWH